MLCVVEGVKFIGGIVSVLQVCLCVSFGWCELFGLFCCWVFVEVILKKFFSFESGLTGFCWFPHFFFVDRGGGRCLVGGLGDERGG